MNKLNYNEPFIGSQPMKNHQGPIYVTKFSSDGLYVLSGSLDRTIVLWNPFKALPIKTYSGIHNYEILDVCITPDNNRFCSVGGDKNVFMWDVGTGKVIAKWLGHDSRVNSVAYHSNVIVTGSYDGTVRCWDERSSNQKPMEMMKQFKDSVTKVILKSDKIYAASVDGCVRCYDLAAGQLITDNLFQAIHGFDVSVNEKMTVSSCLDNILRICDRASGEILQELKGGHKADNYKIECKVYLFKQFSDDGCNIVSGSEDGYLYIYDILKKQPVQKIQAHGRVLSSVDISNKKAAIITGSFDGTIRLWNQQ